MFATLPVFKHIFSTITLVNPHATPTTLLGLAAALG